MLKEIKTGDWSIADIRGIFSFMKKHGGRTFGVYDLNPAIASRYANKMILSKYYEKVSIKNEPIKYLTDEEFRAGKPGYILGNFRTELRTPQL